MDDTKVIKTIFKAETVSVVSDTKDEATGEAAVGYQFGLDTSIPELAFALAGFLKMLDNDEDIKKTITGSRSVGSAFIALLEANYNAPEE